MDIWSIVNPILKAILYIASFGCVGGILFNLQFTIYNKYFDPLLLILIFLIFEFDIEKHIFKNKNQLIKFFSILSIYLLMGLFKGNIFTTINAP